MSGDSPPYLGLRPFTAEDADRFFARRRWTEILVANATASRLTVLYAESGVGKTSVLRAGLEHELLARNEDLEPGEPKNAVVVFRSWQQGALHPLLAQIGDATPPSPDGEARNGEPPLHAALRRCALANTARVVLVLDQFEEFLLYHGADDTPESVPRQLAAVLGDELLPVTVVISLREDALPKLDPVRATLPRLFDNTLRLDRVGMAEAGEAIRGPIERYNEEHQGNGQVTIEPELVDAVIREVTLDQDGDADAAAAGTAEVELAYLGLVLERLWNEAAALGTDTLGIELLRRFPGGAKQIVDEHVCRAVERLSESDQALAADAFGYLVTPSGGKYAYGKDELAKQVGCDPSAIERIVKTLSAEGARVLRPVGVRRHGATVDGVEIYHDKLADPIVSWRTEQLDARRRAEQEQARRERARRARRRKLGFGAFVGVIAAAAVVCLVLALSAISARNAAQREKAAAGYVGLTSTARFDLVARPDVSLLLALSAFQHVPSGSSRALAVSGLSSALEYEDFSRAVGILHGNLGAVTSVAFSPNGTELASAAGDGTVRLWDVADHRQAGTPLKTRGAGEFTVAFSSDGTVLAAGGGDGTVTLWNLRTRRRIWVTDMSPGSAVNAVAFSPRGDRLAAASLGGAVDVWTLRGDLPSGAPRVFTDAGVRNIAFSLKGIGLAAVGVGQPLEVLNLGTGRWIPVPVTGVGQLYTVAIDPRTHWPAVAGLDHAVWLLEPRRGLTKIMATSSSVKSIAFTRSGNELAAATADGTVWVSNPAVPGAVSAVLTGHTGAANGVAFSPSGLLAAGDTDRTIGLWRLPAGPYGQALPTSSHWSSPGAPDAVAFDPSGSTVASAVNAQGFGAIDLWANGRPLRQIFTGYAGVRGVAFSPDGTLIASADQGGAVRLWYAGSGRLYRTVFNRPGDPEFDVAFSPARGGLLAFVDKAGSLRLWSLASGRLLWTKRASANQVFTVAFSPDGTLLATGGDDRAVRIWRVATGAEVATLVGHTDAVFAVAFSPDGRLLASGSADDTVRLWNATTYRAVGPVLTGPTNWVRSVAFSPDSATLVSANADGTIRIWDVADPADASPLGGALVTGSFLDGIAFDPHGDTIATAGRDGKTRLWSPIWPLARPSSATTRAVRQYVCHLVGAGLTLAEQRLYAPGLPYRDPCPR